MPLLQPERRVLFLVQIWPERHASAASSRTLSLIEAHLEAGFSVTVSADGRENQGTSDLRDLGCTCVRMAPNNEAFDRWVSELSPLITYFDRFTTEEKFGWRVRAASPLSLRILDTIDLHFLRLGRQKALSAGRESPLSWAELRDFSGDLLLRELASIYRSDLSLLTSDFEMKLLVETCGVPASLLHLCRLLYPRPPSASSLPTFEERQGFIMVGTFRHPPNEDALRYLRFQLWPGIRSRLPRAEVRVWGAHAQPKHLELRDLKAGLKVEGFLDHLPEAFRQARVNLAPLRYGAGIKGKIADGWAHGTPALASPVAAEGMHDELPFGGLVGTGAEELIAGAVTLYENETIWKESAGAGLRIIDSLYGKESTIEPLIARIKAQGLDRDRLRFQNLTGDILWQQSLRSTEYFSRWLEAKGEAKRGFTSE